MPAKLACAISGTHFKICVLVFCRKELEWSCLDHMSSSRFARLIQNWLQFDMGGAGAVFGAAHIIGQLKPPGLEVGLHNWT